MIFQRNDIISHFPWLKEKNLNMVISADYDGLICASLLHHHLNWQLEGYYDLSTIWVSEKAISKKKDLIWVDLNILPKQGRAIGGHIVSLGGEVPEGFQSSCNPNILAGITAEGFENKYPFSTLIYLLWLHNVEIRKDLMARLLVLHSDAAWLKYQHYSENCKAWQNILKEYNWKWLFQKINSVTFEKRIDEELYPILNTLNAASGRSKLSSNNLGIKSRQLQFNPDWDEDVVLKLFNLFAKSINWTPPKLPVIKKRIEGVRRKIHLNQIKKTGLKKYLNENKVFSYAIPSPRIFNFTSFGFVNKSPLDKKHG